MKIQDLPIPPNAEWSDLALAFAVVIGLALAVSGLIAIASAVSVGRAPRPVPPAPSRAVTSNRKSGRTSGGKS